MILNPIKAYLKFICETTGSAISQLPTLELEIIGALTGGPLALLISNPSRIQLIEIFHSKPSWSNGIGKCNCSATIFYHGPSLSRR